MAKIRFQNRILEILYPNKKSMGNRGGKNGIKCDKTKMKSNRKNDL